MRCLATELPGFHSSCLQVTLETRGLPALRHDPTDKSEMKSSICGAKVVGVCGRWVSFTPTGKGRVSSTLPVTDDCIITKFRIL